MTRFWTIFFLLMLIAYLIRLFLKRRGVNQRNNFLVSKLLFASMPVFLLLMWIDDSIGINEKISNTAIGAAGMAVGFRLLFMRKRGK